MVARKFLMVAGVAAMSLTGAITPASAETGANQTSWHGLYNVWNYQNYEQREPCQRYRALPQELVGHDRCATGEKPVPVAQDHAFKLLPVIAKYEVYFDFDKSGIRADQVAIINKLAAELHQYNPSQITVTGHTDTSGSAAYNAKLSEERARAVSKALTDRNIPNFLMSEIAAGETDLAVPTPDNTRSLENRRVVIEFRK